MAAGTCSAAIAAGKRFFALHPIKNGIHCSFYQPCKIQLTFHRQLSAGQFAVLFAFIHVPAALDLKKARAILQRVVVQHIQRVLAGVHTSIAAVGLVLVVGLAHLILLATAHHVFVHGLVGDDLLAHAYTSLTNFPAVVVFFWAAAAANKLVWPLVCWISITVLVLGFQR